jgi:ankyrin repeat protein
MRIIILFILVAWNGVAFCDEINDAARAGDLAKVKFLLQKDPLWASTPYFDEWTPLHEAADNGDYDMAKVLVDYRADVNAKGKGGRTPLHLAVMYDQRDIVELLLANGADVNAKDDDGVTPLHYAAWHGYLKMAKMLLKHGADTNAMDKNGETPLGWATERGDKTMIKLLQQGQK